MLNIYFIVFYDVIQRTSITETASVAGYQEMTTFEQMAYCGSCRSASFQVRRQVGVAPVPPVDVGGSKK